MIKDSRENVKILRNKYATISSQKNQNLIHC